jgi:prepilin-type N-terminal cleavage/methylation domain-containing protein
MRRLISNQRGMTLAEVMVALPIITIGLLALLSTIPLSTYAIQDGSQTSTATFLANQRLDQVRNAQWLATCPATVDTLGVSASSTAAPADGAAVTTFADENPIAAPYAAYTRQVRITDSVASTTVCNVATGAITGTYGLRTVTVTVTYRPLSATGTSAAPSSRSVAINMQIAQR